MSVLGFMDFSGANACKILYLQKSCAGIKRNEYTTRMLRYSRISPQFPAIIFFKVLK